ncbi:MAG: ArsR family transcriptional regulator [Betaproteobacteria bacterium]|nr:ArsR family transcriptional regulator [Betaproteobacteria bacterium]
MGTTSPRLTEALFSKTQRRVLGLLFGHPERSYYANQIVRFADVGVGAVHRELEGLAAAGLVTVNRIGNQKHYRANPDSPIFEELRSIVSKVLGPAGRVADRFECPQMRTRPSGRFPAATLEQPRAGYDAVTSSGRLNVPAKKLAALCRRYGVKKLCLFGSAARGELTPGSDVDLMVEFKPESRVSLWDFPKLQEEFSVLFSNRRVELVPPEVMKNPFRRKSILPDLRVLYEG